MTNEINKNTSENVKFVVTLHLTLSQRNKLQQMAIKDNRTVPNFVETCIVKQINATEVVG
jgi:hypothetical protein